MRLNPHRNIIITQGLSGILMGVRFLATCLKSGVLKMLRQCSRKAKKNKLYVSKLPRTFVFWCAFDSAKFKLLIFFARLIFFQFFMNLLVKIYMKRHDRHNKALCTTDFFNSVFCLVSCSSINQVPYFILNKVVTYPNLTRLLLRKKKMYSKVYEMFILLSFYFYFY